MRIYSIPFFHFLLSVFSKRPVKTGLTDSQMLTPQLTVQLRMQSTVTVQQSSDPFFSSSMTYIVMLWVIMTQPILMKTLQMKMIKSFSHRWQKIRICLLFCRQYSAAIVSASGILMNTVHGLQRICLQSVLTIQ